MARRAGRAGRAGPEQAKGDPSKRGQVENVLADDELARDWLERSAGAPRRPTPRATGGNAFSVFEEIFAPTRHEANLLLESQRLVGAPAPAPSDPPFLEPVGEEANSDRYRGRVVIPKAPRPDPAAD